MKDNIIEKLAYFVVENMSIKDMEMYVYEDLILHYKQMEEDEVKEIYEEYTGEKIT